MGSMYELLFYLILSIGIISSQGHLQTPAPSVKTPAPAQKVTNKDQVHVTMHS